MCVCVLAVEALRDVEWEYFQKAEGKMMTGLPTMSGGKELKKLSV